jgi:hypothetical protein
MLERLVEVSRLSNPTIQRKYFSFGDTSQGVYDLHEPTRNNVDGSGRFGNRVSAPCQLGNY